jgi:hypothetical protein
MPSVETQPRSSSARDEARMSLFEHIAELRARILRVLVTFFSVPVVAWFLRSGSSILWPPHHRLRGTLVSPASQNR